MFDLKLQRLQSPLLTIFYIIIVNNITIKKTKISLDQKFLMLIINLVNKEIKIKLTALDQSPIRSGSSATEALQETVSLAQICEKYGYHRYWLAEHHATSTFAGSAPEIMVARIAAATDHIRVGSGGVMLSHYSPL